MSYWEKGAFLKVSALRRYWLLTPADSC